MAKSSKKSRRALIVVSSCVLLLVVVGIVVLWGLSEDDPPTPIFQAVMKDDAEWVRSELQKSPESVNMRWRWLHNATPLVWARSGAVAQLLLEAGADVNAADDSGATPLHNAVRQCKPDVVRVLLSHGAAVNARENSKPAKQGLPQQFLTPLDQNLIELQRATLDSSAFPPRPLPDRDVDQERKSACEEIRQMLLQSGAKSSFDRKY